VSNHYYEILFGHDADYIVFGSYQFVSHPGDDWSDIKWVEHTRWMIPGTQLEDT